MTKALLYFETLTLLSPNAPVPQRWRALPKCSWASRFRDMIWNLLPARRGCPVQCSWMAFFKSWLRPKPENHGINLTIGTMFRTNSNGWLKLTIDSSQRNRLTSLFCTRMKHRQDEKTIGSIFMNPLSNLALQMDLCSQFDKSAMHPSQKHRNFDRKLERTMNRPKNRFDESKLHKRNVE